MVWETKLCGFPRAKHGIYNAARENFAGFVSQADTKAASKYSLNFAQCFANLACGIWVC